MSKHIAERFIKWMDSDFTGDDDEIRAWFDAQPELDHTTAIDEALAGQVLTIQIELQGLREVSDAQWDPFFREVLSRLERRRNAIKEGT